MALNIKRYTDIRKLHHAVAQQHHNVLIDYLCLRTPEMAAQADKNDLPLSKIVKAINWHRGAYKTMYRLFSAPGMDLMTMWTKYSDGLQCHDAVPTQAPYVMWCFRQEKGMMDEFFQYASIKFPRDPRLLEMAETAGAYFNPRRLWKAANLADRLSRSLSESAANQWRHNTDAAIWQAQREVTDFVEFFNVPFMKEIWEFQTELDNLIAVHTVLEQ